MTMAMLANDDANINCDHHQSCLLIVFSKGTPTARSHK